MQIKNAHAKNVDRVREEADTQYENGLSRDEAQRRREEYGPNTLPGDDQASYIHIFLSQFASPLIYILLVAAGIMWLLDDVKDAVIIATVLIFNAVVGTILEGRAQSILAELKKVAAGTASVKRDGRVYHVDVMDLVVGDIIILRKGDRIPADARLIEEDSLQVDESLLTGESTAVNKQTEPLPEDTKVFDRTNMVFKGTAVIKGEARAVVVSTGLDTEVGSMHETVAHIDTKMPLQKSFDKLSYGILYAISTCIVVLCITGLLWGKSWERVFLYASAIFVSSIPEGLPVILTIVLALGTQRMLQRNVLVKRLQAVGGLARVSVLLVDKTGTLTRNEMVVTDVFTGRRYTVEGTGYEPEGRVVHDGNHITPPVEDDNLMYLAHAVLLLSDSHVERDPQRDTLVVHGDPTEAAMMVFAQRLGYSEDDFVYNEVYAIPYSDEHKMHFGVYTNEKTYIFFAGAPEKLIALARKAPDQISQELERMVNDGVRVIGIGYYEVPKEHSVDDWHNYILQTACEHMTMLGLCGMRDPVREDAPTMVKKAQQAGYTVVMATGDHAGTAEFVARETHILDNKHQLATGDDLDVFRGDIDRLQEITVFARVTPDDKYAILQTYQRAGYLVAMTGDGVNDVPALTAADVSIAMGKSGTDIAQKAADIVLLDDAFSGIVYAIEESWHIIYTLRRVILFFLTTDADEMLLILMAMSFNLYIPVTALQILWINFIDDGLLDFGVAMEPREGNLMQRGRSNHTQYYGGLFDLQFLAIMFYMALPMALITFVVFYWYLPDTRKAQTMAFVLIAAFQIMNAWNYRSETQSLFSLSPFQNRWLIGMTIVVIILQASAVHLPLLQTMLHTTPLSLQEWVFVVGVCSYIIPHAELYKYLLRNYDNDFGRI